MNRPFLFLLFLFPAGVGSAQVRVGLFQKELPTEINVRSPNGITVVDIKSGQNFETFDRDEPLRIRKKGDRVVVESSDGKEDEFDSLRIDPVDKAAPLILGTAGGRERELYGWLEIKARTHELLAINTVSDEDYVAAVVGGEMPSAWPLEALKAQAVLARTYLQKNHHRHSQDGYDVCDITHCQVYKDSRVDQKVLQATIATRQEILFYQGKPVEALFHSTCGGITTSNDSVWPENPPLPYLQGQPDVRNGMDCCRASPYYAWSLRVQRQTITDLLQSLFPSENFSSDFQLTVADRDRSGRIKTMNITDQGRTVQVSGDRFYLTWGRRRGWHELKSTLFKILPDGPNFRIEGKGLGHGVGMCQYGAKSMAESGLTYKEILSHYFPGTTVGL